LLGFSGFSEMKGNAAWSPVPFRLADEAHELLFDDHVGHALHFGEAAREGGCEFVQRDDLLHGLFWQFLAGRW
jgi:hypothetical protein